jgi:HPt (histidine-containing phosphotransfer) domain-containing protein
MPTVMPDRPVPPAATAPLSGNAAASGAGELPALPGIDTVAGLRRMLNKTALYERVLREFHQRCRDEALHLRAALAAGDLESAGRRAHSAKGLAGSIGAGELQAAAGDLEMAIRHGSDDLEARLERFAQALQSVIAGIAAGYGID